MTKLDELEQQRLSALKKVDEDYYNPRSPNYADNERYMWAISTINEKIKDTIKSLQGCPFEEPNIFNPSSLG